MTWRCWRLAPPELFNTPFVADSRWLRVIIATFKVPSRTQPHITVRRVTTGNTV